MSVFLYNRPFCTLYKVPHVNYRDADKYETGPGDRYASSERGFRLVAHAPPETPPAPTPQGHVRGWPDEGEGSADDDATKTN